MFCVHEVVAPLCVTLALPIHLTVVGLRPRANWHSHPWCNPGAQGHQLPCVTNLAPNKGLEVLP